MKKCIVWIIMLCIITLFFWVLSAFIMPMVFDYVLCAFQSILNLNGTSGEVSTCASAFNFDFE